MAGKRKRKRISGLIRNMQDDGSIEVVVPPSAEPTTIKITKMPRKRKMIIQSSGTLDFRQKL
jgi:acylphosphatase